MKMHKADLDSGLAKTVLIRLSRVQLFLCVNNLEIVKLILSIVPFTECHLVVAPKKKNFGMFFIVA